MTAIVGNLVPRASLTHLDGAAESSAGINFARSLETVTKYTENLVAECRRKLGAGVSFFRCHSCVPAIDIPQPCQECAVSCRRKTATRPPTRLYRPSTFPAEFLRIQIRYLFFLR